eukprot:364100-Chlamydomonas_euryale.AAC.43
MTKPRLLKEYVAALCGKDPAERAREGFSPVNQRLFHDHRAPSATARPIADPPMDGAAGSADISEPATSASPRPPVATSAS